MPTSDHSPPPPMAAAEFRAALAELGFAQSGLAIDAGFSAAARYFGRSVRQLRAWGNGAWPVPAALAVALRLMLAVKRAGRDPFALAARGAGKKRR